MFVMLRRPSRFRGDKTIYKTFKKTYKDFQLIYITEELTYSKY